VEVGKREDLVRAASAAVAGGTATGSAAAVCVHDDRLGLRVGVGYGSGICGCPYVCWFVFGSWMLIAGGDGEEAGRRRREYTYTCERGRAVQHQLTEPTRDAHPPP